ncbi:hypothetical protein BGY98DRAFT_1181919 [Russula aff. rugulosa BPL654]|nr:hypothetical protein BGY98DRAFT_1181919 [Russula aff. rugulosa BPL654]
MHGIERNTYRFSSTLGLLTLVSRYHTRLRRNERLTLRRERNTLTLQASQTDLEDDGARRLGGWGADVGIWVLWTGQLPKYQFALSSTFRMLDEQQWLYAQLSEGVLVRKWRRRIASDTLATKSETTTVASMTHGHSGRSLLLLVLNNTVFSLLSWTSGIKQNKLLSQGITILQIQGIKVFGERSAATLCGCKIVWQVRWPGRISVMG